MKLLASDYDSTLFTSESSIKSNIQAIKKFRANGNKFALITGRSFWSINNKIHFYRIPYDYLSCNDGSVIFDNNNNIVSVEYLNQPEIKEILYFLSRLKEKGYIHKINFYNEYSNVCPGYNNIVEIGVKFKRGKKVKPIIHDMIKIFRSIEIHCFDNEIYIKKHKNKSMSVQEIAKIEGINPKDIFTIGDGKNDFEMIRDFNGYNMLFSNPSLYKVSNGTVMSVKQLVKKINK